MLESTILAASTSIGRDQPPVRKHDLWNHQLDGYHFAYNRPATLIAASMGCGKSLIAIALMENWKARSCLILCPLSVLAVWRREFAKHSAIGLVPLILDSGSVAQKTKQADAFNWCGPIVVNYDAARCEPLASWLTAARWDLAVLDESHRTKSAQGKTSRLVQRLGRLADARLCLTGTPCPHSPLDIYGQFRFLDPTIFGTSFVRFRAHYAVTDRMFPSRVLRWINQDELSNKIATITYRVGAEVLDLPPVMHEIRSFDLSPKARRHYKELEQDLITEVEAGVVTVSNALVKLLRLQQITSGFLPTDEGGEYVDDGKEKLLTDLLMDLPSDEPVIVFCRFRNDLRVVRQVTDKLGRRYGELSGNSRDLTDHAAMRDDVDVMGVQVQSGGVGVDFSRAAYAVYYSVNWSLGDYDQSLARLHRPGQTRPVRYYHLIASDTVDEQVYAAFMAKRKIIETVLAGLSHRRFA